MTEMRRDIVRKVELPNGKWCVFRLSVGGHLEVRRKHARRWLEVMPEGSFERVFAGSQIPLKLAHDNP